MMNSTFQSHSANPEAFAGAIHILEAIGINVSRAWSYARQSKGKSIPVSLLLVFSELMVLPSALFFDLWGMIFNRRGLGLFGMISFRCRSFDHKTVARAGQGLPPKSRWMNFVKTF